MRNMYRGVPDEDVPRLQRRINELAQDRRPMDPPTSPESWWALVDAWWPDLLDLGHRFGTLSAGKPVSELIAAKERRDWEAVHNWLSDTWGAAPDSGYIHGLEGWSVLCDLCSEAWVFEPKQEAETE